jgi:hypothetical protein
MAIMCTSETVRAWLPIGSDGVGIQPVLAIGFGAAAEELEAACGLRRQAARSSTSRHRSAADPVA